LSPIKNVPFLKISSGQFETQVLRNFHTCEESPTQNKNEGKLQKNCTSENFPFSSPLTENKE
jgi:hypothetical protein